MADAWIEVPELKKRLGEFFAQNKQEFSRFGTTVNQAFEAFVIAQVVGWYKTRLGWETKFIHPIDPETKQEVFRLKFSTRGRPAGYTHIRCSSPDGKTVVQIRHQLRVATRHNRPGQSPRANMCLDVAVIKDGDLEGFSTDDHVTNENLVSFGEAEHMSAFAELVAGFVGMVHELQPERLKRVRRQDTTAVTHPSPFLFVSGKLWQTAEGILMTIQRRKYDINLFSSTSALCKAIELPTAKAVEHGVAPDDR